MNIQIFLLHHLPAKQRKEQLITDLSTVNLLYPINWIENFLPEEVSRDYQYSVNTANASLNLKHKYTHQYIIKNNIDYGIVLEDDIDVLSIDSLQVFFEKCLQEMIIENGDILWVGGTNEIQIPPNLLQPNKYTVFHEKFDSRCTHGYIINKKGAQTVINNFHLNLPIDHLFNEIIRNNKTIKSGWTHPFLTQKTIRGVWPSLLK